jgi:hypothetical protein
MNALARSVCVACLPLWLPAQAAPQQPAGLEIRVLQGEGAVHQPGRRGSQPLVVEVIDEAGRPVEGALVSFRLPSIGPGGVFANGLPSEVIITGRDGRAAVGGARWNTIAGPFHVRVTAAKGETRAGILVAQSIERSQGGTGRQPVPTAKPTEAAPAGPRDVALPPFKPRRRWLTPFLIAAGAAAGGVTAGFVVSRRGSPSGQPADSGVTIGPPSITIGPPK